MLNNVSFVGRLTKDPELNYIKGSGKAVCNFTLAVKRNDGSNKSDFLNISVFGKSAENLATYMEKGGVIGITGSARSKTYEKNGETIYSTYFLANTVSFLSRSTKANNNETILTEDLQEEYK